MSHITILFLRGVSYLAAAAFSLGYLVRLARGLAKSAQPSLCPSGLVALAAAVVGLVADLVGPVAGLAAVVVAVVVGLGSADFAGFADFVVAAVVAATSPSL